MNFKYHYQNSYCKIVFIGINQDKVFFLDRMRGIWKTAWAPLNKATTQQAQLLAFQNRTQGLSSSGAYDLHRMEDSVARLDQSRPLPTAIVHH